VTTSNFDKRLLIEQIRYLEAEHKLACNDEQAFSDHSVHKDFEQRLWQRAQCMLKQHDLSPAVGRAARLSRYARTIALIVAVVFGALGIVYAITDSFTINIYWLLLILLGFNLLSMLLWLVGISLNMKSLTAGLLARLASWLPDHVKSKSSTSKLADRAWLHCNFTGSVGKWQFSKITHQLWLVYLFSGLAFLVLMLMVRQYDFVWGTTLLSDNVFLTLTDVLSVPLQALGFATPSAELVHETRVGLAQTLTVEHRTHWAQFLLGALLCFGIVPRILLLAWSVLMSGIARRRFRLDFYLPYYIRLRQKLMPLASHGQIIDADNSPPVISATPAKTPVPHTLPAETLWVAVELGLNIPWPPLPVSAAHDLGQVIDRASLESILQHLHNAGSPVLAVAVSSARPPDRGIQRVISSLMANSNQSWLVLLQSHEDGPVSSTRLAAWYRLAEASKVPADHVISMSVS
jgi:hypothetical protein